MALIVIFIEKSTGSSLPLEHDNVEVVVVVVNGAVVAIVVVEVVKRFGSTPIAGVRLFEELFLSDSLHIFKPPVGLSFDFSERAFSITLPSVA